MLLSIEESRNVRLRLLKLKAFSPSPRAHSSALPSGMENGFKFSGSAKDQISRSCCRRRRLQGLKLRKRGCRVAAAAHKTTSSGPLSPGPPSYQQSSTPSSPWRFSYPPATLDDEAEERNSADDEAEERNSGCAPQEDGMPAEKANTGSIPQSAITGGIPCYFEESRYSSHPPAPPLCRSAADDDEAEERNSGCTPQENGVPAEKADTGSPLQGAITGGIPCYFEESRYSSHPPAPPLCTSGGMEQLIKEEKLEVTEPEQSSSRVSEQSSSHVILVSRILKGIPQSPHFLPLKGYSDVAKHSLINAWDCTFEEVVDQIQSMQVNGFWVNAKRLWHTMQELQNMGYNVIAVRRRLVELTDVVLRIRRHRREVRELKSKAEGHMEEKSRLEFEIMKLRDRVEAEKARFEDVMVKVKKMEQKMSQFDDLFSIMATQKIKIC